jgi:hypothetical protein
MKRTMYIKRLSLFLLIILILCKNTASVSAGFGALTNSAIKHSAKVLTQGRESLEAYMVAMESAIKSTTLDGTELISPGTITIGQNNEVGMYFGQNTETDSPALLLIIGSSTGTIVTAGSILAFDTQGTDNGVVTDWQCNFLAGDRVASFEMLGPTTADISDATFELSSGVYSACELISTNVYTYQSNNVTFLPNNNTSLTTLGVTYQGSSQCAGFNSSESQSSNPGSRKIQIQFSFDPGSNVNCNTTSYIMSQNEFRVVIEVPNGSKVTFIGPAPGNNFDYTSTKKRIMNTVTITYTPLTPYRFDVNTLPNNILFQIRYDGSNLEAISPVSGYIKPR